MPEIALTPPLSQEGEGEYAQELADKTAQHDQDVTAANLAYENQQAERERVQENAKDAAEWALERRVADAWRDEVVIDDNHSNGWPWVSSETAAGEAAKNQAVATAQRDYTVGMSADRTAWIHAVGDLHVALAGHAKTAADDLADDLKTASDGLTSDQADAARGLADDLASAEADYTQIRTTCPDSPPSISAEYVGGNFSAFKALRQRLSWQLAAQLMLGRNSEQLSTAR